MAYNPTVDVLAVLSGIGVGAYLLLYDVTSYFPQVTVLQFGLANNQSHAGRLTISPTARSASVPPKSNTVPHADDRRQCRLYRRHHH